MKRTMGRGQRRNRRRARCSHPLCMAVDGRTSWLAYELDGMERSGRYEVIRYEVPSDFDLIAFLADTQRKSDHWSEAIEAGVTKRFFS